MAAYSLWSSLGRTCGCARCCVFLFRKPYPGLRHAKKDVPFLCVLYFLGSAYALLCTLLILK
jgi:hypothetical protein